MRQDPKILFSSHEYGEVLRTLLASLLLLRWLSLLLLKRMHSGLHPRHGLHWHGRLVARGRTGSSSHWIEELLWWSLRIRNSPTLLLLLLLLLLLHHPNCHLVLLRTSVLACLLLLLLLLALLHLLLVRKLLLLLGIRRRGMIHIWIVLGRGSCCCRCRGCWRPIRCRRRGTSHCWWWLNL